MSVLILKSSDTAVGNDYQIDAIFLDPAAKPLVNEFRDILQDGINSWEDYENRIHSLMTHYHLAMIPGEGCDRRANLCCVEFLKTRGVNPVEFEAEQPFEEGIEFTDGPDPEADNNLGYDRAELGRHIGALEASAA